MVLFKLQAKYGKELKIPIFGVNTVTYYDEKHYNRVPVYVDYDPTCLY